MRSKPATGGSTSESRLQSQREPREAPRADGLAQRAAGADLKIPVTEYAYGNGTHNLPYFQRAFDRSFPLILKALGE